MNNANDNLTITPIKPHLLDRNCPPGLFGAGDNLYLVVSTNAGKVAVNLFDVFEPGFGYRILGAIPIAYGWPIGSIKLRVTSVAAQPRNGEPGILDVDGTVIRLSCITPAGELQYVPLGFAEVPYEVWNASIDGWEILDESGGVCFERRADDVLEAEPFDECEWRPTAVIQIEVPGS